MHGAVPASSRSPDTPKLEKRGKASDTDTMQKRIALIVGSIALAALVLAGALLLDPLAGQNTGGGEAQDAAGTPTTTNDLPIGAGDPPQGRGEIGGGEGGRFERQEPDRTTILTWDRFEPMPQGRGRVTKPAARILFSPQRVMTIRADRGTILAPNNKPREGHFVGRVVVTMYRTGEDRTVSLTGTRDVAMRVYLEEADFDLELGRLSSDGRVHVTGPRVDFRGQGLTLNYNELHERLQRLRIDEGHTLRLRAASQDEPTDKDVAATQPTVAATQPTAERQVAKGEATSPDGGADAPATQALASNEPATEASSSPAPAAPPQFYRARFQDNVRIEAQSEAIEMRGDQLDAVFSFDAEGGLTEEASASGAAAPAALPGRLKGRLVQAGAGAERVAARLAVASTQAEARASTAPATVPATQAASPGFNQSLMKRTDRDVVIRWSGPLVVTPEPEPPAGLTESEDILLALGSRSGRAVTVNGRDESTVTAARLEYRGGSGRLTAQGRADRPLRIASPAMGELTGRRAVLEPQANRGYVDGPGTLDIRTDTAGDDASEGSSANPRDRQDADRLAVQWQDRLNLRFASETNRPQPGPDDASARAPGRDADLKLGGLGQLRTAGFHGQVRTEHPRFALSGRSLTVRFAEGASDSGRMQPTAIEARGQVTVTTKQPGQGDEPEPVQEPASGTLRAEQLDITLEPDEEGQINPSALTARRRVRLTRPGLDLHADRLDAGLVPAWQREAMPATEAQPHPLIDDPLAVAPHADTASAFGPEAIDEDPGEATLPAQLDYIVAERDVKVNVDDPALELTGQRLVLRPRPDRMTLIGTAANPAKVRQTDGELIGQRLRFNEATRTIHVPTAGRFTFKPTAEPSDEPDDRAEDADAQTTVATTLETRWQRSMRYNHRTGEATLRGQVRADTASQDETTHLECERLDLTFAQMDSSNTASDAAADDDNAAESETIPQGERRLASLLARHAVIFTAQSLETNDQGQPHTRLRLEGPRLHFDRKRERVQVTGDGRMLIEDHRPADEANDKPANDNAKEDAAGQDGDQAVAFSGRGQTLFTWAGALTIDAAKSDMLLEKRVWMIHRPAGEGQALTLDCEHLRADLTDTGGLGMWQSDQAPDPKLRFVQADANVVIEHAARVVRADHLKYRRAENQVALWAEGQNLVEVIRRDQPSTLRAKRIEWNLQNNQLDATGVEGGSAPVPQ
jgi:hypothetical protein